ncbi:hypothetical protein BELL_0017g00030 [Botrytis elliptica]|uniref:Uncharacterized protein n=1 Tax=Botrytis elliptica TaxID=278938 RepID=A0A4Z1K1I4_9HELO|nr:hypothetical protein BELL_0017g00030 [Botrytis elliptica]
MTAAERARAEAEISTLAGAPECAAASHGPPIPKKIDTRIESGPGLSLDLSWSRSRKNRYLYQVWSGSFSLDLWKVPIPRADLY